jgi:hypothetical protein
MAKRAPTYTPAEHKAHMRDFERQVIAARSAWRRGQAVVILSFKRYLQLTKRKER